MVNYDDFIFSAVTEIVAATMEETKVELNAEGGKQVAEYFLAIYNALTAEPVVCEAPVCEAPVCDGKYEVIKDGKGEYRFCLKAANGEIIAVSEGYKKKASCLNGIESVRRNAAAEVCDLCCKPKKKAAPKAEPVEVPAEEAPAAE